MNDAAAKVEEAGHTFRPETEEQVRDAVSWAVSEQTPLAVRGHGSKAAIGRPVQAANTLDLSALSGMTLYEPEELVLSAKAGTPVAELHALLAENYQEFAFEPMDYGPLLGGEAGRGTLGGLFSANLAGPRRIRNGAARDHVLGIRAVTGRGDIVKSGGRVVKNVTGYDLSKGLAGAWGTLAVATELTFKVLPRAESETTLVLLGLDDAQACEVMALAMGSVAEVSAAAHLPETVRRSFVGGVLSASATVLRIDGFAPSVEARFERLAAIFKALRVEWLNAETSRQLWREVRDVKPYADGTARPIWRVSTAPASAHAFVMALRMEAGVDAFYDWQGGLVWMRMESDPEAELVRRHLSANGGGHATLVRADPAIRAAVPVFQPQPAALHALSKRLKAQFDPTGVLEPGRMVADI
ncbi:glycolate oxidase subunit GlcE [Pararhizobium mangrovi]|uniref:Glycolate oxidase subunit GlcE n=1 Tax=Pararhizobium mangrovi TaxID=2590452 RepID=A0A506TYV6_9HYPH|nr:glycolate oxidase subunit GlcE [Pararhizobium mangrovi]TPW25905.1 glycolate oxidase subunit GlcE [Pararhizobium mangrovi]